MRCTIKSSRSLEQIQNFTFLKSHLFNLKMGGLKRTVSCCVLNFVVIHKYVRRTVPKKQSSNRKNRINNTSSKPHNTHFRSQKERELSTLLVFVFCAFMDSQPHGMFVCATSGMAFFSFTFEFYCIIRVKESDGLMGIAYYASLRPVLS